MWPTAPPPTARTSSSTRAAAAPTSKWQWRATGDYFQLVARHSGKCLDVVAANTANTADIQQYACGSGTNQQWSRTQP